MTHSFLARSAFGATLPSNTQGASPRFSRFHSYFIWTVVSEIAQSVLNSVTYRLMPDFYNDPTVWAWVGNVNIQARHVLPGDLEWVPA